MKIISVSTCSMSAAMASLFRSIKTINILVRQGGLDPAGASKILEAFRRIDAVLAVMQFETTADDREVRELINARDQARAQKNWDQADRLRDQLKARGVMVRDGKINQ